MEIKVPSACEFQLSIVMDDKTFTTSLLQINQWAEEARRGLDFVKNPSDVQVYAHRLAIILGERLLNQHIAPDAAWMIAEGAVLKLRQLRDSFYAGLQLPPSTVSTPAS